MLDKYIESKIDGRTYNRTNGHFTRHLRDHGITYQDYYETYITGRKVFCPYCGHPCKLRQANHCYTDTCGARPCANQRISKVRLTEPPEKTALANERRRQTTRTKYGVDSISQVASVIDKIKATNQQIAVDGKTVKALQQEKTRATKLARYGDEFYNNNRKISESKKNHTKERKEEINQKRRETCLEVYGVYNHLMRPEITAKTASSNGKFKEYVLPSGRTIMVQGYEPIVLNELLKVYAEDDVITANPQSRSTNNIVLEYTNLNRSRALYYPDIYISSENRIIEVKSRWWFDGLGREKYLGRLENNMRKWQAAKSAGYEFEFWIFDTATEYEIIR